MPLTHRATAALLCALSGLATLLAMGGRPGSADVPLLFAAGGGAFVAGLACARLFGHPGGPGAAVAAIGAIVATLVGAALAGTAFGLTVGQPLLGLIVGPAAVGHAILFDPVVLLVWSATMAVTHLVQARLTTDTFLPS